MISYRFLLFFFWFLLVSIGLLVSDGFYLLLLVSVGFCWFSIGFY